VSRKGALRPRPGIQGAVRAIASLVVGSVLTGAWMGAVRAQDARVPTLSAIEAAADSGRTDEARRRLGRWLQSEGDAGSLSPDDRAHADYLRARLAADPDSAALIYTQVAIGGGSPWAAAARLRLAQLRLAGGQYERALADLATLRADFPGDSLAAESWVWTGETLAASGDTTRACDAWRRAVGAPAAAASTAAHARAAASVCPGGAGAGPAVRRPGQGSAGGDDRWVVQLGAFSTSDAAGRLQERATRAGLDVRVVDTTARDGLYRVWTQIVPDSVSAKALQGRIERAGFPAITVRAAEGASLR